MPHKFVWAGALEGQPGSRKMPNCGQHHEDCLLSQWRHLGEEAVLGLCKGKEKVQLQYGVTLLGTAPEKRNTRHSPFEGFIQDSNVVFRPGLIIYK